MPHATYPAGTLFTVGHSTRPIEEFIALLDGCGVRQLVDIRTLPRSKYNPQFNDTSLAQSLPAAGIAYTGMKELGGLRRARKDSPNTGWRNGGFRGYADYMLTPAFEHALAHLIAISRGIPTAIMCAEAVPWRCHRSLVADALTVRGILVADILSAQKIPPHTLTAFAHVEGTRITYPPGQLALL